MRFFVPAQPRRSTAPRAKNRPGRRPALPLRAACARARCCCPNVPACAYAPAISMRRVFSARRASRPGRRARAIEFFFLESNHLDHAARASKAAERTCLRVERHQRKAPSSANLGRAHALHRSRGRTQSRRREIDFPAARDRTNFPGRSTRTTRLGAVARVESVRHSRGGPPVAGRPIAP